MIQELKKQSNLQVSNRLKRLTAWFLSFIHATKGLKIDEEDWLRLLQLVQTCPESFIKRLSAAIQKIHGG